MSTYGCVIVSRNDNYGGNLNERAAYAINSCIQTYDEVIYVDWNSRGKTLIEEIEPNLLKTGKLRCLIVTPEEHHLFTMHYNSPQPCSEVLGRNVGLRRLNTDYLISTNVDEINPSRNFLEERLNIYEFVTVARRGTSLEHVESLGLPTEIDKIRDVLVQENHPQSWAVSREPYSKVEWCGDLQAGHRDIWYAVKGYSQFQLGVGFHDSYIQRKIMSLGIQVIPSYSIPIFHIDHGKGNAYSEFGILNDTNCLKKDFNDIPNNDNWGCEEWIFKEFTI
jgi:hypothetical protein